VYLLLAIYPFVAGGLTFLAIFVFLRSMFPRPVARPGAILASLFAVWAQYHLSPQSLGLIVGLLVLTLVWRRETRWRMASMMLFAGLIVSHPTTTLILLSILVTVALLHAARGWGWWKSPEVKDEARYARGVTAAYVTAWLAWLFFQATGSSQAAKTAIVTRIGALIGFPESALNVATARTTENLYAVAPVLRLGSLALYGLLGFVALFFLRREEKMRSSARFLFASIFALALVAGADIVGFGGQFYDRSLLLFAVFAPALCLAGIKTMRLPGALRRGAFVVLVGATLAAASTMYYQEPFNQVFDESIALSHFLQRAPSNSVVLDGSLPPLVAPIWLSPFAPTPLTRLPFYQVYPTHFGRLASPPATYAVFDPTAEIWYAQWYGINIYRFYVADQANASRIYDNGRSAVYYLGG
jgi:hypothetical protein